MMRQHAATEDAATTAMNNDGCGDGQCGTDGNAAATASITGGGPMAGVGGLGGRCRNDQNGEGSGQMAKWGAALLP